MATTAARGSSIVGTPSGGTWATTTNAYDGAAGSNPATYAVVTSAASGQVSIIEIGGYNFSSAIGANDTINSVTVSVRNLVSNTGRWTSVQYQPYDGATPLGTVATGTLATGAHNDQATFAVTLAQIRSANFKVRVTATHAGNTQSGTFSLDYADVTVDYTPSVPITQGAYRFYAEGSEAGSAALATQDTAHSPNVGSGDVNLQLRVRMQAGAVVVPASDFKAQYAKNGGAWTDVGIDPFLLTTYPFSQYSSWVAVPNASGQSFTGNGEKLSRMAFDIHKFGAPPGSYTAALYAHSGTFGTSSVGTGAALATSTTSILGTDLVTGFGWVFFDFDESFTLVNGTNYVMALVRGTAGDASNCVEIVFDSSAPTRPGNACTFNGSTWTAVGGTDYMTRVYTKATTPPTTVVGHYSPAMYGSTTAIVESQPTTQRLTAGTGSFLAAGTMTGAALHEGIGWSANNYIELLFAITLKSVDLVASDTLTFRVLRNNSTADLTYSVTPTLNVIKTVPSITQAAYRFYDDTGTEATSPPLQAQDTPHTGNLATGDGTGQFRVRLQSTTAIDVPATDDFRLEWEKNASGTWNVVPSGAVIGYDSPTLTEAGATTSRLTGGTGTFVAGKIAEDGVVDNLGWAGNNFTELVFSVKLVAAQLTNGDTIRFRVVKNGVTTNMTYSVMPTIDIAIPPSTWTGSAGSVGVAGTSGSFSESVWSEPIPEAGLVGWWDADDAATITASGGAVSQWTDKSGNDRQAVQATGTLQPTTGTRTINGHNALDFNDDMLGYLPITLTQPITLFIVVQADFTDALNRQIIGNWGTNPTVYAVGQTWNIWNGSNLDSLVAVNLSPHYLRAVFDGASSGLWIDGTTAITGTLPATGWSAQTFGIGAGDNVGPPGYFWDGLIAEVIAYNRVLTAPEIADVESYLSTKWIPAVVPGGKPKVWTGSAWAEKPIKVWTGSAWVEKPLKVWTGSSWVLA